MHYEVSGSADGVAAWSESRLQFQPHSWQKEYRQALRTALGKLVASPEQGLLARYLAPNDDFVDVENVLLYNIGTGLFAPLIRGGITCRRDARPEALHNLTYRVVDSPPDPGGGAVVGRVTSDLTTECRLAQSDGGGPSYAARYRRTPTVAAQVIRPWTPSPSTLSSAALKRPRRFRDY